MTTENQEYVYVFNPLNFITCYSFFINSALYYSWSFPVFKVCITFLRNREITSLLLLPISI